MSSLTGPMKTIYFIGKPGETRDFTTPTSPSPTWASSLVADGYKIFRLTFSLPPDWDSAGAAITVNNEQVEDVTEQFANQLTDPFAPTDPPPRT